MQRSNENSEMPDRLARAEACSYNVYKAYADDATRAIEVTAVDEDEAALLAARHYRVNRDFLTIRYRVSRAGIGVVPGIRPWRGV